MSPAVPPPPPPESWLQLSVEIGRDTLPAAEELLSGLGALVSWTESAGGAPVLEPGPGETPLWDRVRLTGLFPRDADAALLGAAILGNLPDARGIASSVVADRDWDADWRRQLKPLRFGERLWVCPEGQASPLPGGVRMVLEPGMAFGTGTHPTTAMCLTWLTEQALTGRAVLDYGCGSGILAVGALLLGAAAATGTDVDPQALKASSENAARNGCAERLKLTKPEALSAGRDFDVLVANILSGILVKLSPTLRRYLKPGAPIALSGILSEQATEVVVAFSDWAELAVTDTRDGWVMLTGRALRP